MPEFDWIVPGLQQWIDQVRPLFRAAEHPPLWLTERLTRVNTRHIDSRFAAARDAIGLDPSLTLHCLRHSYVTHLVEFGYPERFVTEQVGHAYASTTAIYTSVSNDFKNKALQNALSRLYHPTSHIPAAAKENPDDQTCHDAVKAAPGDGRPRHLPNQ